MSGVWEKRQRGQDVLHFLFPLVLSSSALNIECLSGVWANSQLVNFTQLIPVFLLWCFRCDPEGLSRCGSGALRHWQQDPQDPEIQRLGPWSAWGSVPPDQEGCCCEEALGEKQEGKKTTTAVHFFTSRTYSFTSCCYNEPTLETPSIDDSLQIDCTCFNLFLEHPLYCPCQWAVTVEVLSSWLIDAHPHAASQISLLIDMFNCKCMNLHCIAIICSYTKLLLWKYNEHWIINSIAYLNLYVYFQTLLVVL